MPVRFGFELSLNSTRETPDGNALMVGANTDPLKRTCPALSIRKGGVPEGADPRKRSKPPLSDKSKKSRVPVMGVGVPVPICKVKD